MDFAHKLNTLLEISGLTNSKVAHTISIDPSLVSRWRSGARRPQRNSPVLVQLATCFARSMPTRHQQNLLAQHIPGENFGQLSPHDLAELVFAWLCTDSQTLEYPKPEIAGLSNFTQEELAFSNSLSGPPGRQLVIEQLFAQFDPHEPHSTILFYSSDPIDWIRADTAFQASVLEEYADIFRNVSRVKLITHNNASDDEYIALVSYVLRFAENGIVQIAQIPRYRKNCSQTLF